MSEDIERSNIAVLYGQFGLLVGVGIVDEHASLERTPGVIQAMKFYGSMSEVLRRKSRSHTNRLRCVSVGLHDTTSCFVP
jgi:hypothetical protein